MRRGVAIGRHDVTIDGPGGLRLDDNGRPQTVNLGRLADSQDQSASLLQITSRMSFLEALLLFRSPAALFSFLPFLESRIAQRNGLSQDKRHHTASLVKQCGGTARTVVWRNEAVDGASDVVALQSACQGVSIAHVKDFAGTP